MLFVFLSFFSDFWDEMMFDPFDIAEKRILDWRKCLVKIRPIHWEIRGWQCLLNITIYGNNNYFVTWKIKRIFHKGKYEENNEQKRRKNKIIHQLPWKKKKKEMRGKKREDVLNHHLHHSKGFISSFSTTMSFIQIIHSTQHNNEWMQRKTIMMTTMTTIKPNHDHNVQQQQQNVEKEEINNTKWTPLIRVFFTRLSRSLFFIDILIVIKTTTVIHSL